MTKKLQYQTIVQNRKQCRTCVGLTNPSDPKLAHFDSNDIGPWSRLYGDLDADLMIVGQDWGDVRYFLANQGLDNLANPTMRTLEKLLRSVGMDVSLSKYSPEAKGLFLTNAILCLKGGGLQAKVQQSWVTNCATLFLKAQIEIVRPRVVVSLGQQAYRAICLAFRLRRQTLRTAVEAPSTPLQTGSVLVPVYHCGTRVLNTHRPLETQFTDWLRVREALR